MNEEENAAEGVVAEQEEPLPQLSFSDDDTLQLPVVGAVLLNYSMDKLFTMEPCSNTAIIPRL